jgi:hypothetical protein
MISSANIFVYDPQIACICMYRTRQLDAWLRDVVYHYRLMSSAGKAEVRSFLNIVASSRDDYVPERDGGTSNAYELRSSVDSEASHSLVMESIQNRLNDGLFEAPRAENYDHVMKGAQKNRQLLHTQNTAVFGGATKAQAGEDDDDDNRSEDSRVDEEAPAEQVKNVKPFTFRSMFSKHGNPKPPKIGSSPSSPGLDTTNPISSVSSPVEHRVNRYLVPEANVSGQNPFLVPFLADSHSGSARHARGIMGLLEVGSSNTAFHIRHHDFDPNLFVFEESSKESVRISSGASAIGRDVSKESLRISSSASAIGRDPTRDSLRMRSGTVLSRGSPG